MIITVREQKRKESKQVDGMYEIKAQGWQEPKGREDWSTSKYSNTSRKWGENSLNRDVRNKTSTENEMLLLCGARLD